MLLASFKGFGRATQRGTSATTPVPPPPKEALLAAAEAALEAAIHSASPFRRDALYDEVVTLMARALGPMLWRYCVSHHGFEPARAEELAQDALLALRLSLPGFEGRSSLKTFLYAIVSNLCRADRAKEARRGEILAAEVGFVAALLHRSGSDPEAEAMVEAQRLAALECALAKLPPREAFLVRARLGERFEYEQILPRFQARFGDTVKTVEGLRTLFFHAKARLITLLREEP